MKELKTKLNLIVNSKLQFIMGDMEVQDCHNNFSKSDY